MALSRQQALNRLAGLEEVVLWHFNEHIPQAIGQAPAAVSHWRTELNEFLNVMQKLANGSNLGSKTSAEWKAKIIELRRNLEDLLGGD